MDCKFSWLSLDPGFDFDLLFGDHFAQHVYAYCQLGESLVAVENENELAGTKWASKIKNLQSRWRLIA